MAFDPEASRQYMELVERRKQDIFDRAVLIRRANEARQTGEFPPSDVVRVKSPRRSVAQIVAGVTYRDPVPEDLLARIECDECGRKILPVRAHGGYILPWHNTRYLSPGHEPVSCPGSLSVFTWEATG